MSKKTKRRDYTKDAEIARLKDIIDSGGELLVEEALAAKDKEITLLRELFIETFHAAGRERFHAMEILDGIKAKALEANQ